NIEGVLHAEQFAGADVFAQINAAEAALGGNPGTIDASNYTGTQTITSGVLLVNNPGTRIIMPPIVINTPYQIYVPSGTNSVGFDCPTQLSNLTGCRIQYNGNGTAVQVGDASGQISRFSWRNIRLDISL